MFELEDHSNRADQLSVPRYEEEASTDSAFQHKKPFLLCLISPSARSQQHVLPLHTALHTSFSTHSSIGYVDTMLFCSAPITPKNRFALQGHQGVVYACRFAPSGDRLASCSADGTVRMWNVLNVSVDLAMYVCVCGGGVHVGWD